MEKCIKKSLEEILGKKEVKVLYETIGDTKTIAQSSKQNLIDLGINNSLATRVARLFEFKALPYGKKDFIRESKDVYHYFLKLQLSSHEEMHIMLLSTDNSIICIKKIADGNLNSVLVPIHKIAREALIKNAASVILCHNHPSGNLQASKADIQYTEKAKKALDLIEIKLSDHIIVAGNSFTSLADEGHI